MSKSGKNEIGEKLRETAEDLVELVTAQIKLTRLELVGDARTLGARLGRLAVFAVLLVVGYGFANAAAAWLLAGTTGLPAALAIVGGANIVIGGAGVWRVLRAMHGTKLLDRTNEELGRNVQALAATAQPTSNALASTSETSPQSVG